MEKLRIAEIFSSIQGEGSWVGIPSTFVRVSGCNMRCTWCDTPYASWKPEGPVLDLAEIVSSVRALENRHVVLTGGEPMFFEGIEELCRLLAEAGKTLTIETAGTVFRDVRCDLMSISPKLVNSTPDTDEWHDRHERVRLDRGPLKRLVERYPHQLKFVVNPEADLEGQLAEVETVLAMARARSDAVLLMAEGTDSETLHRRERLLVPVCVQMGWRLTPRLHIDLFGNTRGT